MSQIVKINEMKTFIVKEKLWNVTEKSKKNNEKI